MIEARESQIRYYRWVPLYRKVGERYILYKPEGVTLSEMRIRQEKYPKPLYMHAEDKIRGLNEAQKGFNRRLKRYVASGDSAKTRKVLVTMVEETLSEPRAGSLEGFTDTLDILLKDWAGELSIVEKLIDLSSTDYCTTLHSINVMALALKFAHRCRLTAKETKTLGLGALLHDVGKTRIRKDILVAPRRLTGEEFDEMKGHTVIGHEIIKSCNFNDRDIGPMALEHHEKLDGSGYPRGNPAPSYFSQVVGMIDCYEALTTDDRPYRNAAPPMPAMELIRKDVNKGRYSKPLFECFAHSLT